MNPHRSGSPGGRNSMLPDKFGNPENDFPGDKEQIYDPAEVEIPSFLNDTPTARAELAEYYQSISRLDRGIGRLIQVLRDTGKLDSTLIVYISDNGAAFPQAKTTLYEPGMRLPCIVRSPIHKNRGTTCDGLITWTDITPTLLDFAGLLDNPEAFHGRSFKDILDEPQPENWRDHIFASHSFHEITNYYPMRVLRSDRYKFIYNIAWKLDYPFAADLWDSSTWQEVIRTDSSQFGKRKVEAYVQRPRYELYDLENDPDELVNLADKPEHAETVERFAGFIKEFQEETDDPWAIKWLHE
jgi:N-sulfoglucosamine sulfohydrolase